MNIIRIVVISLLLLCTDAQLSAQLPAQPVFTDFEQVYAVLMEQKVLEPEIFEATRCYFELRAPTAEQLADFKQLVDYRIKKLKEKIKDMFSTPRRLGLAIGLSCTLAGVFGCVGLGLVEGKIAYGVMAIGAMVGAGIVVLEAVRSENFQRAFRYANKKDFIEKTKKSFEDSIEWYTALLELAKDRCAEEREKELALAKKEIKNVEKQSEPLDSQAEVRFIQEGDQLVHSSPASAREDFEARMRIGFDA